MRRDPSADIPSKPFAQGHETFTNRWAAWVLAPLRRLRGPQRTNSFALADIYLHALQLADLAPEEAGFDLTPYDALLQRLSAPAESRAVLGAGSQLQDASPVGRPRAAPTDNILSCTGMRPRPSLHTMVRASGVGKL